MSDKSDPPPLDPRSRRRLARTGIPRSIVRRETTNQPVADLPPTAAPLTVEVRTEADDAFAADVAVPTSCAEVDERSRPATSDPSAYGDRYQRTQSPSAILPPPPRSSLPPPSQPLKTYVAAPKKVIQCLSTSNRPSSSSEPEESGSHGEMFTPGPESAKRARPYTSSSGSSEDQEDKRVKLSLALPTPQPVHSISLCSPSPASHSPPPEALPQPPSPAYLARQEALAPDATHCNIPIMQSHSPSYSHSAEAAMHGIHSHSAQSLESASWPKDSTSYAGLASPTSRDVPMLSPQPSTSYAAAAAAPRTPCHSPPPAAPTAPQRSSPTTVPAAAMDSSQPAPLSSYPPLVVECLPNWTRHFEALRGVLGHAPNARPLGRGMRFLPKSAEEFRAVQRYLTQAAAQDSTISWYCYSPASEIPTKVAIRGLPLETPTEEVVAALRVLGFPAEAARAIPPPRGKHGCTYYVRLAHMTQDELKDLYEVTELLYMPQVTVEAWRGGTKPPQCHRCQTFSHNSVNCHRPFRCVRCAGPHPVRDCTRSRDDPPTCANCGQSHAANDRRCSYYKREARRRGIILPPPPPRATAGHPQQRRVTTVPPASATAPPATTAPSATTTAPSTTNAAPTTTQSTTHPTTLTAEANPPTQRGQPLQGRRMRKRNRIPRPRHTEPTAASTPQPRQTRVTTATAQQPTVESVQMPSTQRPEAPNIETRNEMPAGNSEQMRFQRTAPRFTQPHLSRPAPPMTVPRAAGQPAQAPPSASSATQQTQGEAQTNPDFMAIVRVVMEAIMTGIIYWNPGGIRGHVRELTTLAQSQDVHVILLGETKLANHLELRVPNFFVYRRDEVSPRGFAYRGTAALVRRDLVHEELEHAPYTSLRTQGVRVQAGDKELNIYAAYRPPNETFCGTDVHTLLESQIPTLVVGDLNAKHQAWGSRVNSAAGRMLLEDSERYNYGVLGPGAPTNIPTTHLHQPDVLDIVLHYRLDHPISVEPLYDLNTEHLPILVTLNLQRDFTIPRPPSNKTNWEKYAIALSELELVGPISTAADVDRAACTITSAIQQAKREATTTRPYTRRRDLLPSPLRDKLEKKRALRKLWARTRCPRVKRDLNRLAQEVSLAVIAREDEDWEKTIDAATESETTLYHLCKTLTGSDSPIYPLLDSQGTRRYSAKDRAEIMAEYMEDQFTPNPPAQDDTVYRHHAAIQHQIENFLSAQTPPLQGDDYISPLELRKAVFRLPKRKAPGYDGIPIAAIQQLPKRGLVALTRLFNGILRTAHFPDSWKSGKVITIPKPGKDRRLPGSYRPITLLPHIAKLFERLLLRRLAPHTSPRAEQFGFRSNHSTTLQLARGLNFIASEKNRGYCTVGVFLDIEKAFDRVWHAGLLAKLLSTNLPPAIVRLVASFLEGRSFRVSVEGVDSQLRPIRAGVPQGSCLSPCLYAVYTDDIPTLAEHLREGEEDVLLSLYADDSAYLTSSYHQIVAINRLQRLLDLLPEWLDKWRMAVNVGKTAAILFGARQPYRQLRLRGQDIEWQTSVRYLGCHIDVSLHMVPMVNHAVNQARAATSMLRQVLASSLSPKTKLRIYGAYVRSRLTYAAPAWYSFCSEYQRRRLQVQQNKCLRLIVEAPRYVRNDVIHRDLKTPTVEEYVRTLARRMFARADNGPYEHLHGIAPLIPRPPTGRQLPRELLRSPSLSQNANDPSDDDYDDARPTGLDLVSALDGELNAVARRPTSD
nr:uncharacterized protein LOC117984436 [Maniola hyperantus]